MHWAWVLILTNGGQWKTRRLIDLWVCCTGQADEEEVAMERVVVGVVG